jgi:hypothetical protein
MKISLNVVTKENLRYFCHPGGQSLHRNWPTSKWPIFPDCWGSFCIESFLNQIDIESTSNQIERFLHLVNRKSNRIETNSIWQPGESELVILFAVYFTSFFSLSLPSKGGTKILVTGPWYSATCPYSIAFGDLFVPAALVQSGVLRCFTPGKWISWSLKGLWTKRSWSRNELCLTCWLW